MVGEGILLAEMTYVRGKKIAFTAKMINELLRIPAPSSCLYHLRKIDKEKNYDELILELCRPGATWYNVQNNLPRRFKSVDMTRIAKAWSAFVHQTILPCSNTSDVIIHRAQFILLVLKQEDINVGAVISREIQRMAQFDDNTPLAFPSLICLLCKDKRVQPEDIDTVGKPMAPITGRWIMKQPAYPIIAPPAIEVPDEHQVEEQPPAEPEAENFFMAVVQRQLTSLLETQALHGQQIHSWQT